MYIFVSLLNCTVEPENCQARFREGLNLGPTHASARERELMSRACSVLTLDGFPSANNSALCQIPASC